MLLDLVYLWRGEKKKNSLPAAWVSQKAKLFLVKTTKQAWAFICIFSATGHRHLAHIPGKDLPTPLLQSNSEINVLSWIRTTPENAGFFCFFKVGYALQSASWLSCQVGSHQVGLTASVGELSISGIFFFYLPILNWIKKSSPYKDSCGQD